MLDLGASFINSDHADMLSLVDEFGLSLFDRNADAEDSPFPATAYVFDGRSIPESEVAQALRPLARRIGEDAALIDEDFDTFAPDFDAQSVAEYLDANASRIRRPFVRRLVENSIRTEYGVEPSQSSALQLLFNLPVVDGQAVEVLGNSDEAFVVEGGTQRIVDALGRALGGRIQLGRRLLAVQQAGAGYDLRFSGTSPVVRADYVVLALPLPLIREVQLDVDLPNRLRRFFAEVDLGRNEKVFAGFAQKAWRRPDGFTADGWSDLGFSALWDATQRQTGRTDGALTFYTGGQEVADLRGANASGSRFVAALDTVLPGVAGAATGDYRRTDWANEEFTRGAYVNFAPGQLTRFGRFLWIEGETADERQDVVFGNLAFAGEHLSDAFYGFMNGAAETGRLAAEAIARRIRRAGRQAA